MKMQSDAAKNLSKSIKIVVKLTRLMKTGMEWKLEFHFPATYVILKRSQNSKVCSLNQWLSEKICENGTPCV